MVRTTAGQTNATSAQTLDQLFIADVDVNHGVDSGEGLQRFSLGDRAREAIQQIAALAVLMLKPLAHDVDHDAVRNQLALVDVGLGSQAGRRLVLDRTAENVAGRNLGDPKPLAHANGLGALARTGRAEKNQIHVSTSRFAAIKGNPCGGA